jgi:hypothetical protein
MGGPAGEGGVERGQVSLVAAVHHADRPVLVDRLSQTLLDRRSLVFRQHPERPRPDLQNAIDIRERSGLVSMTAP